MKPDLTYGLNGDDWLSYGNSAIECPLIASGYSHQMSENMSKPDGSIGSLSSKTKTKPLKQFHRQSEIMLPPEPVKERNL